jgi:hypothetical protein
MEVVMTEATEKSDRHFFRGLFKFLVIAGVVGAAVSAAKTNKAKFVGMTESEVRAKFEPKLAKNVGDEKAAEIADMVIPKLKDKGLIKADNPAEQVARDMADTVSDAADDIGDKAGDIKESVADAVEDLGKKLD